MSASGATTVARRPVRTSSPDALVTAMYAAVALGRLPRPPACVLRGHAHRAGPVAGRDGRRLVGEEDAVGDVAAARDRAEGRGAVQPPIDPAGAVSADAARHGTV